jgi:hypothetical protein
MSALKCWPARKKKLRPADRAILPCVGLLQFRLARNVFTTSILRLVVLYDLLRNLSTMVLTLHSAMCNI